MGKECPSLLENLIVMKQTRVQARMEKKRRIRRRKHVIRATQLILIITKRLFRLLFRTHVSSVVEYIWSWVIFSEDRDIHLLAPRYFGFFETLKKVCKRSKKKKQQFFVQKLRLDYYDRIAKNSSNAEFRNSIVFLRSITTTSIFDSIEKMFLEKYTHFPPPSSYDYFYSAVSYFLPWTTFFLSVDRLLISLNFLL